MKRDRPIARFLLCTQSSLRLHLTSRPVWLLCCHPRFGEGVLPRSCVLSPRLGVAPGSFFSAVHRITLPLAREGALVFLFTSTVEHLTPCYNWSTIGVVCIFQFERDNRLEYFYALWSVDLLCQRVSCSGSSGKIFTYKCSTGCLHLQICHFRY
jgi:hypothetical protein